MNVNIALTGANPVGAQSVHWWLFPTNGFGGVTPADFDIVNDRNPACTSGIINGLIVPTGYTLYLDEHFERNKLGTKELNDGCGGDCGTATAQISVTGSVASATNSFSSRFLHGGRGRL